MKDTVYRIYEELLARYPSLAGTKDEILSAYTLLYDTARCQNTIFVCGNGGSAADSEHIVGELMKSFKKPRLLSEKLINGLPKYGKDGEDLLHALDGGIRCISLTSHLSLSTAFANDKLPEGAFAQQLSVLGKEGDTLIAISTSGNSRNCVLAAIVAKTLGMKVVTLTGEKKGKLAEYSDVTIAVPERETFKIQEMHLPIYHCICGMLEESLF